MVGNWWNSEWFGVLILSCFCFYTRHFDHNIHRCPKHILILLIESVLSQEYVTTSSKRYLFGRWHLSPSTKGQLQTLAGLLPYSWSNRNSLWVLWMTFHSISQRFLKIWRKPRRKSMKIIWTYHMDICDISYHIHENNRSITPPRREKPCFSPLGPLYMDSVVFFPGYLADELWRSGWFFLGGVILYKFRSLGTSIESSK